MKGGPIVKRGNKFLRNWQDIIKKKGLLAHELTVLVHGEEEAQKAEPIPRALFSGKGDDANMPTTVLTEVNDAGLSVLELMVLCGLASSKRDARRLIQQGGVMISGEKIVGIGLVLEKALLQNGVKFRKGKKACHNVVLP